MQHKIATNNQFFLKKSTGVILCRILKKTGLLVRVFTLLLTKTFYLLVADENLKPIFVFSIQMINKKSWVRLG